MAGHETMVSKINVNSKIEGAVIYLGGITIFL